MSLFSPGCHFKTSSKSRLSNSIVVIGCPCGLLKSLPAISVLQSSLPQQEDETSSNLNFSSKRVFLCTTRLYSLLLQSCGLWVNFLQQIYYLFPFSPSLHFLQCCLSLFPHHLYSITDHHHPITKSISDLLCLFLGTPIVLHPTCALSCSPVPSCLKS